MPELTITWTPKRLGLVRGYPEPGLAPVAGLCAYCGHSVREPCICARYGHDHLDGEWTEGWERLAQELAERGDV